MLYRRLGKSGLQVSALSFGSWLTFGDQASNRTARIASSSPTTPGSISSIREAYAGGQSEEVMGNAISKFGWSRDTFVVSSKVFWGGEKPNQIGLSKKHVTEACEAALRRLRVDYLDLYYCHRPDPDTPIEETVRAMDVLIQQAKFSTGAPQNGLPKKLPKPTPSLANTISLRPLWNSRSTPS